MTGRRMIPCGNAPGAWSQMTDLDRAFVEWFGAWLTWSAADPETRGDEPAQPDPADYPPPAYAYAPAERPDTRDTGTCESNADS